MPATVYPNGVQGPRLDTTGNTITDLTDNSGGTASDTIPSISASYNQAEIQNALASLAAKINEVIGN